MRNSTTTLSLAVALVAGASIFGAVASAKQAPPDGVEQAEQASGPYKSDMRGQCEAELARDKRWAAELKNQLRPEIHQEDANLTMTNKRHVVLAYAALWAFVVVFLVLLWARQQRLVSEIARLERDVKKASEQD